MNVPEAIGISMFEMDLYQKNLALLQEKCSKEFPNLFPEPFGDENLFAYTISYRCESDHPTLFYVCDNESTKSIAVYFPEYLAGEALQHMLYHLKEFYYYETIVIFCHETNFKEVKDDLTDWRPEKIRMVTLGDDY